MTDRKRIWFITGVSHGLGKVLAQAVLGTDALRRTREKLARFSTEVEAWNQVSSSTDYPQS